MGHDFGGACMSYAMEIFPTKISKAVYISAVMLANGQSTLDLFNQPVPFLFIRSSASYINLLFYYKL